MQCKKSTINQSSIWYSRVALIIVEFNFAIQQSDYDTNEFVSRALIKKLSCQVSIQLKTYLELKESVWFI